MTHTFRIRVGVVLLQDERVLLVRMHRDSGDIFVLPGGGLEFGEGIYECAVREVKEETNLAIAVKKILYLKDLCTEKDHALEIVLLGKILRGKVEKGFDPEEKGKNVLKEVKWISLKELSKLNFHPKQLKEELPKDATAKFKDNPKYLGKFKYPE